MTKNVKSEYTILGQTIKDISIFYGGWLITWSIFVSYISASKSFTSWIPAALGLPILILGILSNIYPNRQKLFMHTVFLVGIFCIFGGLDFVRSVFFGVDPFSNVYVWTSKLMLLISGLIFLFFCIQSFKYIRKIKGQID